MGAYIYNPGRLVSLSIFLYLGDMNTGPGALMMHIVCHLDNVSFGKWQYIVFRGIGMVLEAKTISLPDMDSDAAASGCTH